MGSEALAALIALCGVPMGILLQWLLSARERKAQNKAMAEGEQKLAVLHERYMELLDGKLEHSRRKISLQLEALEDKISEVGKLGRTPDVWIMGINAIGPLHQGREVFIRLLNDGGKLRILLLDPTHAVFAKRSDDEHDLAGRITAEMYASLYILMDIMSQLQSAGQSFRRNVQVRLHQEYPDRSLIMVNCDDQDGIVLENRYPAPKGTRGMEGEMYPQVQRGRTARGYEQDVAYYTRLWKSATPVDLVITDSRLQISTWPFSRGV
jgi:hypothetical protein